MGPLWDRIRPTLTGLTTRGRSFLAAGAAAALCAVLLGQRDLLRIAVLLVALPLANAALLTRTRHRLALTRTIAPPSITVGSAARVQLEIENLARFPTPVLLAEDQMPYLFGASPRFVLDRLPGGRRASVSYAIRPEKRGRYLIGPLRLRITDPFGMCELTRSFSATDPVLVLPRVWPLDPPETGGRWAAVGQSLTRGPAAAGEDDFAVREYRQGDDLRRVHWKSTARRGELMVRQDEQPRHRRATVLVDVRPQAHRGDGATSSFEWAVSAAASAVTSLAQRGTQVRLISGVHAGSDARIGLTTRAGREGELPATDDAAELVRELAVLEPGDPSSLATAVTVLDAGGQDGSVVAILGEGDDQVDHVLDLLLAACSTGPGVALLLRTSAWETLPTDQARAVDTARANTTARLAAAGWAVAEVDPADSPAQAWAKALLANTAGLPPAGQTHAVGQTHTVGQTQPLGPETGLAG